MKEIITATLVLFLFNLSSIFAQTLVRENRLWSNTFIGCDGPDTYKSHYVKFEGDTVINDTIFKKIFRSDDEAHLGWYKFGAIREDSSKKVYLYNNGRQNLLYDFNLQAGDSIKHYHIEEFVYVINVYNIKLDFFEDSLKRIDLSLDKSGNYIDAVWIEEIGSLNGILEGTKPIGLVGGAYILVCLTENDVKLYQNEGFSSCFPQGNHNDIESSNTYETNINVSQDYNNIRFNFNNLVTRHGLLTIYNISGSLIGKYEIKGTNCLEILKNKIVPGIYIFNYMDSRDHIEGKFVVN